MSNDKYRLKARDLLFMWQDSCNVPIMVENQLDKLEARIAEALAEATCEAMGQAAEVADEFRNVIASSGEDMIRSECAADIAAAIRNEANQIDPKEKQ